MSSVPRDVSARARAIIDAAEASVRSGGATRIPQGLPVTPPRRRPAPRPALRAVDAPPVDAAAPPVTAPAPAPPAPPAREIPDPERLIALIERVALQAAEIRRRLDVLSEAVGRVEQDFGVTAPPVAPAVPEPAVAATPVAPAPVATPAAAAPPAPVAPEPESVPVPVPDAAPVVPVAAASPPNETARLVAIEMAVGGASRGEVRDRLVNEFGIRDVEELLDSVYGAQSDGKSRMNWA